MGAPALRDDVAGDPLGLSPVAAVNDNHGVLPRHGPGNGLADALAAAGDQRRPAGQLQIHRRSPLYVTVTA
jgi:hypothetical protein